MRITCRAENSRMRGSAIDDSMLLTVICELLNKFDIFVFSVGGKLCHAEEVFRSIQSRRSEAVAECITYAD